MTKRRGLPCVKCGTVCVRNDRYDTYYCPECMVWVESKCQDPDCYFCKDRPLKPGEDE